MKLRIGQFMIHIKFFICAMFIFLIKHNLFNLFVKLFAPKNENYTFIIYRNIFFLHFVFSEMRAIQVM